MIHYWGNIIEGLFWIAVALAVYIANRNKSQPEKQVAQRASITLFCFGISDFIEVSTGAWYKPIWVLLLKAACVVILIHCLVKYLALRKEKPESKQEDVEDPS